MTRETRWFMQASFNTKNSDVKKKNQTYKMTFKLKPVYYSLSRSTVFTTLTKHKQLPG